MEVIRDAVWERCLADAVKMYRLSEPNDKCYNLADATWKMKHSYKKFQEKKDNRQIIILSKTPETTNESRTHKKICCATTMTWKPCSFKAICGDFCKKHQVKKGELGMKVDISKIKITD